MEVKRVSLAELKERGLLEDYVNHKFKRLPMGLEVRVDEMCLTHDNGLILTINNVKHYTMAKDLVAQFETFAELAKLCPDKDFYFVFGEKQNKRIYFSYRMEG